ncbi:MAG TPA: hypothetical protein VNO30_49330 [Kofleriaceae bacterium]|nr:hypothetical protein [Kofleriaceae bacterium]
MPDNKNKNQNQNQNQGKNNQTEPRPNDQRSNVKNPNNQAFEDDRMNREQQRQGQAQPDYPHAPSASVPQPGAPDKHK